MFTGNCRTGTRQERTQRPLQRHRSCLDAVAKKRRKNDVERRELLLMHFFAAVSLITAGATIKNSRRDFGTNGGTKQS